MIQFEHVTFKYYTESDNVLNDLSFSINRGEWVALVGHNGSGKSTAAKLMNGLLLPSSGTITVNQNVLDEKNIWDIRKEVGMVFQNPENQFVGTTVVDDVAFGLENLGIDRQEMEDRIETSLNLVGMSDFKYHEPHRLSGGQKQRVAIASVLAIMPNIIIFDEATTMLDPTGRKELIQTIEKLRDSRDLTIISITHDLNEAAHTDRVIALNEGQVWFDGPPKKLFERYDQLKEIGLMAPFVTQLTRALQTYGIILDEEPLHYKELVDQIWKLHSTK